MIQQIFGDGSEYAYALDINVILLIYEIYFVVKKKKKKKKK